MKKILNFVLSAAFPPYEGMITTSMETWDSIEVEGVETMYYCGESKKQNTDRIVYFPVPEALYTMGRKLLMAFEWALKNKEFDYLARPHSCIYVNKKELLDYVQGLPDENVFAGLKVDAEPKWHWGGIGFVLSRDVVQKVVDNKDKWDHRLMEDMGLSYLINQLGIPYMDGRGCSIDNMGDGWRCMMYGYGESFRFTNFEDIVKSKGQYFYRVKQDKDRNIDGQIMHELFKYLR
jgi:hypothetical protein